MAFNAGAIIGYLLLDTSNYDAGIKKSESTARNFMREVDRMSSRMLHLGLTMGIVGKQVNDVSINLIKMAAQAEQTEQFFTVQMGKMADSAKEFIDTYSESVGGLNKVQQEKFLATFNAITQAMGINEREAFKLSKTYTMLANDIASYYEGIDPEEAARTLRSGLAGETEPLLRLGIDIRQESLKTLAIQEGVIKNQSGILTTQQRVFFTTKAIMQGLNKAQGDLYRTQDQVVNLWRANVAVIREYGIALGNSVLPEVAKYLGISKELFKVLKDFSEENKELTKSLTLTFIAGGLILTVGGAILILLPQIVTSIGLIIGAINPLTVLITGLTIGLYLLRTAWEDNLWGMRDTAKSVVDGILAEFDRVPQGVKDAMNFGKDFVKYGVVIPLSLAEQAVDQFTFKAAAAGGQLLGDLAKGGVDGVQSIDEAFNTLTSDWKFVTGDAAIQAANSTDKMVEDVKEKASIAADFWSQAWAKSGEQLKKDLASITQGALNLTMSPENLAAIEDLKKQLSGIFDEKPKPIEVKYEANSSLEELTKGNFWEEFKKNAKSAWDVVLAAVDAYNKELKSVKESIRSFADVQKDLMFMQIALSEFQKNNDALAIYNASRRVQELRNELNLYETAMRDAGIQTSATLQQQKKDLEALLFLAQSAGDPVAIQNITTQLEQLNNQLDRMDKSFGNQVFGGFHDGIKQLATEWGDLRNQISQGTVQIGNQITSGIGSAFADVVLETKSWEEAVKELELAVIRSMLSMAAQMVANYVLSLALNAILGTQSVASGAATAAAWAPAAAMVSLATLGANSIPASAGIISTVATAQGAAVVPVGAANGGFRDGISSVPFTGSYLLHSGEKVVPQYDSLAERNNSRGNGGPQQVVVLPVEEILKIMSSDQGKMVIVNAQNQDTRFNGPGRRR